ncbi:MAG: DNA-processing protein DprA [Alphaproteobacteria bacterium]|nr:DNA-processing protein DprA [Alphaproteobacteria bacterium]
MEDILKKLLVLRSPNIGPVTYNKLLSEHGNIDSVIEYLNLNQDFIDSVKREIDNANVLGITYISDDDSLYPENLLKIKNHPIIISVRGNKNVLNKKLVSMVGTRHSTLAGMNFISDLATKFAEHNFAVVSGMAMGTDTAAHTGALQAQGNSQTIAVLAGGVDYIWPLENESLYYEILERGLIISEMPVGSKPNANNFVQRNRWIAGLSDLLIIGEADAKSGSMTTARFALEYNKNIFAVPGHPSDPRSIGPNSLIKNGQATLCMSSKDFFEEEKTQNKKKNIASENEILDKLGMIPVSESVLANIVKKSVSEIKSDLVVLELQGLIRKQDGGYVLN